MSKTAKTTQGHGGFSQYKQDHWKEATGREVRGKDRRGSPERFFDKSLSLHRSSLSLPSAIPPLAEPLEHRHHAMSKSLEELRTLQQLPASLGRHPTSYPRDASVVVHQPLDRNFLPHLTHHHHFGWNPPTPESRFAVIGARDHHYKMGFTQQYNHDVFVKRTLISTRKA